MEDVVLNDFETRPDKRRATRRAVMNIESMFRNFLDKREIEGMGVPGVPTQAALLGLGRNKSKRGQRRPSFVDTQLYKRSFTVDIE